jgi:large-conductance mechanosensitive channel
MKISQSKDNIITPEVKEFIIKYSMVSAVAIWIIGAHLKDFNDQFVDHLLKPILSMDLDKNGEPDLQQISNMRWNIGPFIFPVGKLIYSLLKIT